jgi:hypothetical protein
MTTCWICFSVRMYGVGRRRRSLAFVNLIWPLSIVSFGPTPTLVIRLVEKPAAVGAVGKVGIARVERDFQGRWEGRKTCFWFSSLSTDRLFPQPGGRRVLFFAKSIDRHLALADSKPASRSPRSEHRRRCCPLRVEHVFKRKCSPGFLVPKLISNSVALLPRSSSVTISASLVSTHFRPS